MNRIALIIALATILATTHAHAATAYLVSCDIGESMAGAPIWVGTYMFNGQYFKRGFPATQNCPAAVEVY
jgi:hypothetical protein